MVKPEKKSVWEKIGPHPKIERVLPQVPRTRKDVLRDASRKARLPGKRLSKNNKVYWETRQNRSDKIKSSL